MKKILKIGATDCVGSLAPILMWYFLGILQDSRFANVFILTYSFQFVWQFVYGICTTGNIKTEKKNNESTHSICLTGSFIGLIILLISAGLIRMNIHSILFYYGVDDPEYNILAMFGIVMLVLDYVVYTMKIILQYDDRDREASITCYVYYGLRLIIIVLLSFCRLSNRALVHISTILCFIVIGALVWYNRAIFSGVHFKFRILDSLKINYASIGSNIGMLIIYSLGLSTLSGNEMFLIAYNAMSMATDTQWDILSSAIDTNTAIVVLNGEYEIKKTRLFKDSFTYSIFLFSTSATALIIIGQTLHADIKIMFIFFFLECISFPVYAVRYVATAWVECSCPSKTLFWISFTTYVLRVLATFLIQSKYALSISILLTSVVSNGLYFLYYKYKRQKFLYTCTKKVSARN